MENAKTRGVATLVRRLEWRADARLYRLDPPMTVDHDNNTVDVYEHVVVSAVNAMFTGPETYIFGALENGETPHMCELPGSFRGALDHARALADAGYDVAPALLTSGGVS